MSSEMYSYLYEKVLEKGALDIYVEHIYMKKNRPANKVCILCEEKDLENLIELLFLETSTFGVRYNKYNRAVLSRKFVELDTKYGLITAKLGYYDGKLIKATCEYEECKLISKAKGIPLIKVFNDINCIINQKIELNLLT